jgi:hypothetical protein
MQAAELGKLEIQTTKFGRRSPCGPIKKRLRADHSPFSKVVCRKKRSKRNEWFLKIGKNKSHTTISLYRFSTRMFFSRLPYEKKYTNRIFRSKSFLNKLAGVIRDQFPALLKINSKTDTIEIKAASLYLPEEAYIYSYEMNKKNRMIRAKILGEAELDDKTYSLEWKDNPLSFPVFLIAKNGPGQLAKTSDLLETYKKTKASYQEWDANEEAQEKARERRKKKLRKKMVAKERALLKDSYLPFTGPWAKLALGAGIMDGAEDPFAKKLTPIDLEFGYDQPYSGYLGKITVFPKTTSNLNDIAHEFEAQRLLLAWSYGLPMFGMYWALGLDVDSWILKASQTPSATQKTGLFESSFSPSIGANGLLSYVGEIFLFDLSGRMSVTSLDQKKSILAKESNIGFKLSFANLQENKGENSYLLTLDFTNQIIEISDLETEGRELTDIESIRMHNLFAKLGVMAIW